ncbi:c-type cytochrome [Thiocapsa marina]|uniref:Cytochrome c class I n=1 Tax=Thiocapsa marina 5811 TaxID=768671 RepID=F9UGM5_9GAMM|nr:c-type cytochrome [Thiocapsa marina]EGV16708.1 cytochrome c class I [Thiocapsa marina 5811]
MRLLAIQSLVGVAGCVGVLSAPALWAQTKGDPEIGAGIAARVCVACHAEDGTSPMPNTPRLASQHATYLVKQMKDYRAGRRTSEVMGNYIGGLSEEEIPHVAAYYAAQEAIPGVVTDPSVLKLGRRVYVDGNPGSGIPACSGCHGDEGEGTRRFPRLAGQDVGYTLEQMRLYAAGERTNDRGLMQTVADRMSEAETLAVAQYIASLMVLDAEEE